MQRAEGETVAHARALVLESQMATSTMERGHQMDGGPLPSRLYTRPENSPESNSVQTLINVLRMRPGVYVQAER